MRSRAQPGRIDRVAAGQLPEAAADLLVRHRYVQRFVTRLLATADLEPTVLAALEDEQTERILKSALASPALERMLIEALESQVTLDLLDRVLRSPEFERVLEQVASSPAIRAAMTKQGASLADETAEALRARAARLDDAAQRGRSDSAATAGYGGIATRAIAFGVDAAVTLAAFLSGGALLKFGFSLVGGFRPDWLAEVLTGAGSFLFVGGYFVLLWTLTGQTLGLRLMGLHVRRGDGGHVGIGRSIVRFLGLLVAIATLGLGFLTILFDRQRRGLQDYLAGTVVERAEANGDPDG